MWCFILYGVFIGVTATAVIRNMMVVSMITYFTAWAVIAPLWQNHGLWLSLHILFLVRVITLALALPELEQHLFMTPENPQL